MTVQEQRDALAKVLDDHLALPKVLSDHLLEALIAAARAEAPPPAPDADRLRALEAVREAAKALASMLPSDRCVACGRWYSGGGVTHSDGCPAFALYRALAARALLAGEEGR